MKAATINKDSVLINILATEDRACIARKALEDERLSLDLLGLLLYLCNTPIDQFSPKKIMKKRFGKSERTWSRHIKNLVELGYAQYHRISLGKNKFQHIYIISDSGTLPTEEELQEILQPLKKQKTLQPPNMASETAIQPPNMASEKETVPPRVQMHDERSFQPPNMADKRSSKDLKRESPPLPPPRQQAQTQAAKLYDINQIGQTKYDLAVFFMTYKFPAPRTQRDWEQAQQPGIQAWARVTETPLNWAAAMYVNQRLQEPIDEELLLQAYLNWTGLAFKPQNAKRIIDWYDSLKQDPQSEPWNEERRSKHNGTHQNTSRQSRKKNEHGLSKVKYDASQFTEIDWQPETT